MESKRSSSTKINKTMDCPTDWEGIYESFHFSLKNRDAKGEKTRRKQLYSI